MSINIAGIEAAYKVLSAAKEHKEIIGVNVWEHGGIQVQDQSVLMNLFGHYDIEPIIDDEHEDPYRFYAFQWHHGVCWFALLYEEELTEEDWRKVKEAQHD